MQVLRPQGVNHWEMSWPFRRELLNARDRGFRGAGARVDFVAIGRPVAADPEQACHQRKGESLTEEGLQDHAECDEQERIAAGRREWQRQRRCLCAAAA